MEFWTLVTSSPTRAANAARRAEEAGWNGVLVVDSQNLSGDSYVALTAMALSSLGVFIVNIFYFRPRPFVENDVTLLFYQPTDSSFPSNAVAAVFGIAFAVWGVNRRVGTLFLIGAGLYGFARVFAGVHYPLDIIGGAAIALVVTPLVFKLRDLMMPILVLVIKAAKILRLA